TGNCDSWNPPKIAAVLSEPISQMPLQGTGPEEEKLLFVRRPGVPLRFVTSLLHCLFASSYRCFSPTKKGKRRTAPSRPVRRSLALVTFFLQEFSSSSLLSARQKSSSYFADSTTHRPCGSRNSTPIA